MLAATKPLNYCFHLDAVKQLPRLINATGRSWADPINELGARQPIAQLTAEARVLVCLVPSRLTFCLATCGDSVSESDKGFLWHQHLALSAFARFLAF
jgi:hypothetical protein